MNSPGSDGSATYWPIPQTVATVTVLRSGLLLDYGNKENKSGRTAIIQKATLILPFITDINNTKKPPIRRLFGILYANAPNDPRLIAILWAAIRLPFNLKVVWPLAILQLITISVNRPSPA
jgi:hypothetical protein